MRGILDFDEFGGTKAEYRTSVLTVITSKLPVTVIFGPAGVGKTTLARGNKGKFICMGYPFRFYPKKIVVVSASKVPNTLLTSVLLRKAEKIILLEAEGGKEQILKQRLKRGKRVFNKSTNYSTFYKYVKMARPDAKTCKIRYTGE